METYQPLYDTIWFCHLAKAALMEEALDEVYKGRWNVAVKAKEVGVSTEELKRLFRVYAMQRPMDDDVWRGDVELGWPWT